MITQIRAELRDAGDQQRAAILCRFFKTGKGEYGEGDRFLGITVPVQRNIALRYQSLELPALQDLLASDIHEHRLTALFILVQQYRKADEAGKRERYEFYLGNTQHINNWDLVDTSAEHIAGAYLFSQKNHGIAVLRRLARSQNLWERRIAIMSTFHFIKARRYNETLELATLLLHDKHDLIHKAVGWMLREIGKRDMVIEEMFLKQHAHEMPRTMLRYAIEKFPKEKREEYLHR